MSGLSIDHCTEQTKLNVTVRSRQETKRCKQFFAGRIACVRAVKALH